MSKAIVLLATFLAILSSSGEAQVVAAPGGVAATDPDRIDYSRGETWLCRPARDDACSVDLTTTVIAADGTMRRETWAPDPDAPIDCFYVYPTVSTDPTPNSDMNPDPAETNVVRQQLARFASKCRLFAPLYRQVTLARLRTGMELAQLGNGLQYQDVLDAWNHYLRNDNDGRGVVLIGHSQGAFILSELIRQEIEGSPIESQLVSAMLIGATVPVARGRDAGGAFERIPLCRSAAQTGCIIAYSAFRSDVPPPENTLFGRVARAEQEAACTNPAALEGGSGELHAYLDSEGRTLTGTTAPSPWVATGERVETPWVSVPGLLTARCTSNEHASYLEVVVHGDPGDPRTDDIVGDIGAPGRVAANWGLHLVDVNLAMGNLLAIVAEQAAAWQTRR